MISKEERQVIRELALRLRDLSQMPIMAQRKKDWIAHNDLKSTKPMIMVSPEGAWREIIPPDVLLCDDEHAREMEWKLRARLFRAEQINDDAPVENIWETLKIITDSGWTERKAGELNNPVANANQIDPTIGWVPLIWRKDFSFNERAEPFHPVIEEYSDLKKIHAPEVFYDEKTTLERYAVEQDILGDIMDVRLVGKKYIIFNMMEMYTALRGLEEVMYDLDEEPEMTHEAMDIFEDGFRNVIRQYQEMNLLSLNAYHSYTGTGGFGYTDQLPHENADPNDLKNLWACSENQEFTSVSPQMTEEFVTWHERRLLEPFGLTCFGCCEAIENKIEDGMKVHNMRRISVSPWSNIEVCAEKLQNRRAIYSWKPNPALFVHSFSEEGMADLVRRVLRATGEYDCCPELILKDTHTCQNHPERYRIWTDLVRRVIKEERGIE